MTRTFTVEQVQVDPHAPAGFLLERPRQGEEGDLHALRLSGAAPGGRAVEVVYHGRPIQIAPVRADRWEALVGLVGLRADAALGLEVVLEGGERRPAATLELRRAPLRSGFEPVVQPLLLTSLGRSGSTWLMKMFAAHPEIVVMRRFPYESSAAKYWMHAMKVLSDPANLEQSAHPDSFHSDRWWAGSNPYFDLPAIEDADRAAWLAREHVERLARFFQESVEQWYATVARSQGQEPPRYFAEKHLWPNFLPMLMRELYPGAREVFLVRDFRDVAASALGTDARRGYAGFGKTPGMTDEDFVRDVVARMATDLRRSWESRAQGAHLVRYEDMAQRPVETLAGLLSYLDVDAAPATLDRLLALASQDVPDLAGSSFDPELVRRHRGSRSPQDSIGRWRDRDDAFRGVLDDALGEALDAFGYEREASGAAARVPASGSASRSNPLLPDEYEHLIEQVRETAETVIPRNATVLVVSRGDEELLRIGPRRALHFPQDDFGGYAGYHPQDSAAAIELLEDMRARGAQYLVLPRTDFWWLEFYSGLEEHLAGNYPLIASNGECMVYELVTGVQMPSPQADEAATPAASQNPQLDELLRALLPTDARVAVVTGAGAGLPSFPASFPVRAPGEDGGLDAVLRDAERERAEFLVVPAGARDRVHMGTQPPEAAGQWRIVTRQQHVGDVWERPAAGGRRTADGRPGISNRIARVLGRS